MELSEILSTASARVEADPGRGLIQVTWLRHASGAPFREVYDRALPYARQHIAHPVAA
jgi:hypothetical protein